MVERNRKAPFFRTQALTPMRKAAATDHLAKVIHIASIDGITVNSADELLPELHKDVAMNKPVVIDVYMKNIPTPTAGHWNIMDIYSPGKKVHHVSTDI